MSEKKPKPTCYTCGFDIIFDPKVLSKNNVQIPLDPDTRQPHECKEVKKETQTNTVAVGTKTESLGETVKAEYVDHTLTRPSEVKIFFADSTDKLTEQYKHFQEGKKFAWSRAQYQPVVLNGVIIFSIAFYYEITT